MKTPIVKLSAYERAVNTLNNLSPQHDKIMSAALDELRSQRNENERRLQLANSIFQDLLKLWPYVDCCCGRNKRRIPDDLRDRIKDFLGGAAQCELAEQEAMKR